MMEVKTAPKKKEKKKEKEKKKLARVEKGGNWRQHSMDRIVLLSFFLYFFLSAWMLSIDWLIDCPYLAYI